MIIKVLLFSNIEVHSSGLLSFISVLVSSLPLTYTLTGFPSANTTGIAEMTVMTKASIKNLRIAHPISSLYYRRVAGSSAPHRPRARRWPLYLARRALGLARALVGEPRCGARVLLGQAGAVGDLLDAHGHLLDGCGDRGGRAGLRDRGLGHRALPPAWISRALAPRRDALLPIAPIMARSCRGMVEVAEQAVAPPALRHLHRQIAGGGSFMIAPA